MNNNVRALSAVAGLAPIIAVGALGGPGANAAHLPTVVLGTAGSFAVRAGSGITNTIDLADNSTIRQSGRELLAMGALVLLLGTLFVTLVAGG